MVKEYSGHIEQWIKHHGPHVTWTKQTWTLHHIASFNYGIQRSKGSYSDNPIRSFLWKKGLTLLFKLTI